MDFTFDKFMSRISDEETRRDAKLNPGQGPLTSDRVREIDPNRLLIAGREHWMNRTRGSWSR